MIVNAHGARAGIFNYLTGRALCKTPRPVDEAEALLDAHRTEALTEGARLIEDAACDADWNRPADYCRGLRAGAELLLAKSVEKAGAGAATAAPDFFQPGRTYLYTRLGWKFRCDAVTSHPGTGKRVAVGYSCFSRGAWQTGDLSEGIWVEGGWTDVTDGGDGS